MGVVVDTIISPELPRERLAEMTKRIVSFVLKISGKDDQDSEVSVLFTDDSMIAELNQQYRGLPEATDVLSFPMLDMESQVDSVKIPDIPNMLGDIVISLETARRQASAKGHHVDKEVEILLVHGTLHLIGFDHEEPGEEAVMWAQQEKILKALNKA